MERTLVLLKPDAVQRGLVGQILARFEAKGLKLVALRMRKLPAALLRKHYGEHKGKPFFKDLVAFMSSGPACCLVLEGKGAVEVTRGLMGSTNAAKAAPGTIRGDFGLSFSNNLVHGSDSLASAKREIALFFPERKDLIAWSPENERWVYSPEELPAKRP